MPHSKRTLTLALVLMVVGIGVRGIGWTRGSSDFPYTESAALGQQSTYYQFHPDETTVIRAALALDNPFDPPSTAYGMLPLYLVRGTLEIAAHLFSAHPLGLETFEQRLFAHRTARLIAILLSVLSMGLIFQIGRRFSAPTALLALFFFALAPLAIQQAHFSTVDGDYTLFSLLFFAAFFHSIETGKRKWYIIAGLLIGATASVRLSGLLLAPVAVAGHLLICSDRSSSTRPLTDPRLWLMGLAGLITLLLLQPFLVGGAGLGWQDEVFKEFTASAKIAQGEVLRPWTLVDMHTIPYLHYWTHLLPTGVGWPLTIAFILGIPYAVWRRNISNGLILLWLALYFGLMGGLHTKHVRYLVPILPFLSLLAADMLRYLWQEAPARPIRRVGLVAAGLVALWTGLYGLAFARIYAQEDSRIQAGRWLAENAPPPSTIGLESGGFSLQPVLSGTKFSKQNLNIIMFFSVRDYLTCGAVLNTLETKLSSVDFIAITDANRYAQFTAVPALFPAISAFYRHLIDQNMGFALAAQFKNAPTFLGLSFEEAGGDPSFIGFDHPLVWILHRQEPAILHQAFADLKRRLEANPHCPDLLFKTAADRLNKTNLKEAEQSIGQLRDKFPQNRLVHLLEAELWQKRGDHKAQQKALAHYREGSSKGDIAHLVPWASALALMDLGQDQLALNALADGVEQTAQHPLSPSATKSMAVSYLSIGDEFYSKKKFTEAIETYQHSTALQAYSPTYTSLGMAHFSLQAHGKAAKAYLRALELDPNNRVARINLGWILYTQGKYQQAITQYLAATQNGPHPIALFNLALTYLAQGDFDNAEKTYSLAVEEYGAGAGRHIGAVDDLRNLIARGLHSAQAQLLLEKYWPQKE